MDLQIPERHAPVTGSRDIRPKKLEEWINGLPLANLGETSRQVYNVLLEINALNISVEDRLRALEQLRATTHYVVDSLKKHYVGHPFPLSPKSRKVARLTREILTEMATGYKIVIVEALSADTARIDSKALLTAIHRALRYLGGILLKTYQIYDPYPAGVWREIHKLYEYAEQSDLHNTAVADPELTLIEALTVTDVYKQILLLALACPYRLRQGEVEQVDRSLERWASYADLLTAHGQDAAQALFVASLERDDPPSYRVLHDQDKLGICRLLDTQGLTRVLREEMVQTHERPNGHLDFSSRDISPDIMRRLMLAWGVIPKRRFTRTRKYSHVLVGMGLSTAHHFIGSESWFSPESGSIGETTAQPFQNRASFSSAPIASEVGRMPEFWELEQAGTIDWKSDAAQPPQPAAPAAVSTTAPNHSYQTWKMVNISAGGYCLLWDNPEATQAQVGELICLQESGDAHVQNWGIGVIRWMKAPNSVGLELGVQMLAPSAVAVAVKTSKDDKHFSAYQRSLLLPEIRAIQQPASLLLPALSSQMGGTVVINIHGKEHRVRLTKLLENTGSFSQFNFAPLDIQPTQSSGGATPQEPKDFDSIWSSI